jgi:hypothetical protein
MSLEYSPVRDNQGARDTSGADPPDGPDYWNALVNEKVAAAFLGLTVRTVQSLRQRGDGPRFIRISARCIRYRRIDLKAYADARTRKSTSDPGQAAA